jgi:hypothetical protein
VSRRAATFTQSDVHRALKAAQQAGAGWRVEIEGGVIRFMQGETAESAPANLPPVGGSKSEPEPEWKF